MTTKNLLLELGTEELPPKSLRNLAQSLHDSFVKQLKDEGLAFSASKWYASHVQHCNRQRGETIS